MSNPEENEFNQGDDLLNIQGELEMLEEEASPTIKDMIQAHDPLSVLYKHHPEAILDYTETIAEKLPLQSVPPNIGSHELDKNHRSQPFLTQYEKTRILGFRTNQLAQGARPFIVVPPHIVNTLEIARIELEQRRLPYIIKRPMPDGTFEYWRLTDLMVI